MTTHAKLTFDLMPGLKLDIFGAYSHNETERSQYLPTTIWAHGQAYRGTDKAEQLMGNIVLNCDKLLATVHHINLTALASAQRDTYTGFHTTTTNFSDNTLGYNSIQAGALTLWEGTGSYKSQPTMASVMGKASYDYASRYYLTAIMQEYAIHEGDTGSPEVQIAAASPSAVWPASEIPEPQTMLDRVVPDRSPVKI